MLLSASVSETQICLLYCAMIQEPHTSSLLGLHMGFFLHLGRPSVSY